MNIKKAVGQYHKLYTQYLTPYPAPTLCTVRMTVVLPALLTHSSRVVLIHTMPHPIPCSYTMYCRTVAPPALLTHSSRVIQLIFN